jgi:hypothetical protein
MSDTAPGALGKAQATMLEYIANRAREGEHGDTADLVALINALGSYNEKHSASSNGTKSKVATLVASLSMITALVCFLAIRTWTLSEDVSALKVEVKACQKLNP